jgi:hypothetical protein
MRKQFYTTLLLVACAAGCAGNGDGLNQNGIPIMEGTAGTGPITPDLQSIEDNVFTPICSKCHIGASAPEGLQLDAAHAYNALVGVPSVEVPRFPRVDPGNPDESYMVLKIEGAPGIEGAQMPFGETPLPQATIDAIRQWITNGAPNVSASAAAPGAVAAAAEVFAIQDTVPGDRSTVIAPVPRVVVAFSHEVDASLINDTTLTLERMGDADLDPETVMTPANGAKVAVTRALAAHNAAVLLITPKTALGAGVYRLSVRGTGGGALADLYARTLGADRSFVFTVEPAR